MNKSFYKTDDNVDKLRRAIKQEMLNYTLDNEDGVGIAVHLDSKVVLIHKTDIDTFTVLIKNSLGNKLDEFQIKNVESNKFDFIN